MNIIILKEYINLFIEKNKNYIILLIASLGLFISCSIRNDSHPKGFILQRFEVVNHDLDTTLKSLKNRDLVRKLNQDDDIIILMLKQLEDSTLGFFIQRSTKVHFSNNFIASSNNRVVGYIEYKNLPTGRIIVLSNVSSIFDFESLFYRFMIPTKDKKQFNFFISSLRFS